MDQLTEGMVSRLILIGIEAPDPATGARLSRETARRLRMAPEFAMVSNGEAIGDERDREFLFTHRYLLSPAVTAERFSEAGLHAAISESIDLLASPAGLMVKSLLPRDPTGELIQILNQQDSGARPSVVEGVWASRDGTRALLLAQTRANGSDTDGQERALGAIHRAFDEATAAERAAAGSFRLLLSGPGVFSVSTRKTIHDDVMRLSAFGLVGIVGLLLIVYRSLAGARPESVARDIRRARRHRCGKPRIRSRPRPHTGVRHNDDRRGRGLLDLPPGSIDTAGA